MGIDDFDRLYYLHLYNTGWIEEGCSALGLVLEEDGPAMLTTNDVSLGTQASEEAADAMLKVFSDAEPHGFAGVGTRCRVTVYRSVNDAGLMLGGASGHPKFNWPDNPECLNIYFQMRLLSQHCADCGDVRHFVSQYRTSGTCGMNSLAVDANGNMLGFELESDNIAFREPEGGMLLEVNHWQHPDLQASARTADPDFWRSPNYYNSQDRIHYFDYYRDTFRAMKTLDELIDFSFDEYAPGRLLQEEGTNIDDWTTAYAIFMTSRDRRMRVCSHPLDRGRWDEVRCPG